MSLPHGFVCGCLHLYFVRRWAKTAVDLVQGLAFFLTLCARNTTLLSEWGKYTLYLFLLHFSFVSWLSRIAKLVSLPVSTSAAVHLLFAISFGMPVLVCFGMIWMLTTLPVRKVYGLALEPTWLQLLLTKADEI